MINLCKFKVEVRIFYKKKWSKNGHKSENVHDIKKSVGILLDNLITMKCAKVQVDWMKIVWLALPVDKKKHGFEKNTSSPSFKKKLQ